MFTTKQKSIVGMVGLSLFQVLACCGNHKQKLGIEVPFVTELDSVTPMSILPQNSSEVTVHNFGRFGSANGDLSMYELNINSDIDIDYLCPKENRHLTLVNSIGNKDVMLSNHCIRKIEVYNLNGKKGVALYLNGYDSLQYPQSWRVAKRKIGIQQIRGYNEVAPKQFEEFDLTEQGSRVELENKELIEQFHNQDYCDIALYGEVDKLEKIERSFWEDLENFVTFKQPANFYQNSVGGKKIPLLHFTTEITRQGYLPLEEQSDKPRLCSSGTQRIRQGQARHMDKECETRFGSGVITDSIAINKNETLTIKLYTVDNKKQMRIYWENNFIDYPQEWKNGKADTMLEITTKSGHRLRSDFLNGSTGRLFCGDELKMVSNDNSLVEKIQNNLSALCDVFVVPMVKRTIDLGNGKTTQEIEAGQMVALADLNLTVVTDN